MPQDRQPRLNGANQWSGDNSFDQLYVRNLWVQENLTLYDADSDVSAGASAKFGTADNWDFWLKSANIARLGVTSAGWYILANSQPSSVFASTLASDTFDRANEYPLAGWTLIGGPVSAFQVSGNLAMPSAGNAVVNQMYNTAAGWATAAGVDVRVDISSVGTTMRPGLFVFQSSAGASGTGVYLGYQGVSANLNFTAYRSGLGTKTDFGPTPGVFPVNGTMRLVASATGAIVIVSAFWQGAFISAASSNLGSPQAGYTGIVMAAPAGTPASGSFNNFQVNTTQAPPFAAADLVLQTSASLWDMLGADAAVKHAQVFKDGLHLGFSAPVVFTGLTSAFVSAGTSAYFNPATYGIVSRISAVGASLSGVVGLSGSGLTISAVGNDVLVSAASMPASATWAVSAGIATSAIWASAAASATWATSASTATSATWASAAASATWASTSLSASNWAAAAASASASWFYPGTVTLPGLRITGSPSAGFFSPSAGTPAVAISGVEIMRWTLQHPASAFVGINQPTPAFALDASGYRMNFDGPNTNAIVVRSPNVAGNVAAFQAAVGGTSSTGEDAVTGDFLFYTVSASAAGQKPTGRVEVRVAGGTGGLATAQSWLTNPVKVGINTAAPSNDLTILQTADSQGTGGLAIYRNSGGTRTALFQGGDDNLYLFNYGNGLALYPGQALAMFLSGSGHVGIGTGTPLEKLHVAGTFQLSAVASGNLPAASATRDGMIILDLTASAMVYYVNGKRISAAVGGAF